MTILSVAFPLLRVFSGSAGGAEQILWLLDRALVQNGHQSVVIAASGSQVAGELISTPVVAGEISEAEQSAAQQKHLAAVEATLRRKQVDLIHFHGLDFHRYLPGSEVPKFATLHLPPSWYPGHIFGDPGLHLNCVSESQAATAPSETKLPVVANGIDVDFYRSEEKRSYLLWLGRICPEKGVHIALQVAHELDAELRIAGPVHPFPYHMDYFANRVAPLLDEKRIYAGAADLKLKAELLAKAHCLLVPSLVAETSSLVAMEALASGTPVVAYRCGALPEVIDDGKTGFLADSPAQMTAAVRRCGEISAAICRQTAKRRFSSERMASDYIRLYQSIKSCA